MHARVWRHQPFRRVSLPIFLHSPLTLQKTLREHLGGSVPAAVGPGGLLPLSSLHRRFLCRGEVGIRVLRLAAADCLSQHHGKTSLQANVVAQD